MRMRKHQVKLIIIGFLTICLMVASSTAFADRSDVEDFVTRFYQQCLRSHSLIKYQ